MTSLGAEMVALTREADARRAEVLASAFGPLVEALRALWEAQPPAARAILNDTTLTLEEKRGRLAALVASSQ